MEASGSLDCVWCFCDRVIREKGGRQGECSRSKEAEGGT